MLIMVTGLPGSGKSYFARQLSERLEGEYISSDQTRREMDAMGKYGVQDKEKVYDQMEELATSFIVAGKTVVLDATFYKEELRKRFISLAQEHGLPYFVIWITSTEEIIKERLSRKRADSEADYEVYVKLLPEYEPPAPPFLKLISGRDNLRHMLEQAEDYMREGL